MNPIHLFSPKYRVDEALAEIRECLEKGWTGLGYKTLEFEQAWRAYSGLPHAHFVNSCTAGLHLAIRLLKEDGAWAEGDEVITTPLTFVSTNHVILYERLRPVFADVDEFLCLDPDSVEQRISPRTRAVIFVGLGGSIGNYARLLALCRSKGLALIVDGAHMAGTWIGADHAGTGADAAVFSFHSVKNLPTADGGVVCFARDDLDREVRKWSWMGIDRDTYSRTRGPGPMRWHYQVEHVGFKYHGNSVMAALALVGLRYLESDNAHRRYLASEYESCLATNQGIEIVPQPQGFISSRQLFQVMADGRDSVIMKMNETGIFPGVHYADNTEFPMYSSGAGSCPRANGASHRLISLPMYVDLTAEDVQRVSVSLIESLSYRRLD